MGRLLRKGVLFAFLFACAAPAWAADPILMLLFGIARDMMINRAIDAITAPPGEAPIEIPKFYPGTLVEPDQLRRLIDDSFLYLSESQRGEIFDALHAELLKPKNAVVRAAMIEYFAERALAVRAAQLRLARLTWGEKQLLAEAFHKEAAALPEAEQAELAEVLRRGLLPVPSDLNQLLLTAFAK